MKFTLSLALLAVASQAIHIAQDTADTVDPVEPVQDNAAFAKALTEQVFANDWAQDGFINKEDIKVGIKWAVEQGLIPDTKQARKDAGCFLQEADKAGNGDKKISAAEFEAQYLFILEGGEEDGSGDAAADSSDEEEDEDEDEDEDDEDGADDGDDGDDEAADDGDDEAADYWSPSHDFGELAQTQETH